MNHFQSLAVNSLKEIQEAEKKLKALEPKKLWIENIKKDPQKAASFYFKIFDHLVQDHGRSDKDWEKLSLLLHLGINPLSVKNNDGLNPFEYFYKRNREERFSLNNPSKKRDDFAHQNTQRLLFIANTLYHGLQDFGFTEEQLKPIHKVQDLWNNYQRLILKQENTRRVAFSRLLKTVQNYPEDAISAVQLKHSVELRLTQEKKDEERAWKQWEAKAARDYRVAIHRPASGHARNYSHLADTLSHEDYLLYQPLPVSSQKALDDFLTTFKDLDASRLSMEKVLPKKWVCAYQRTLCRAKKQENTRN